MQRGQRNVAMFRDVGGGVLVVHPGKQQVGPLGQRRQRPADLPPALGERLLDFAPHTAQFPEFPGAAEEIHPEVAVRVQDDLQIRSVGDRGRPGRFDEVNHFRRDGHVHVMPAANQLTADGHIGFDLATRSPVRQHKFHRRGSFPPGSLRYHGFARAHSMVRRIPSSTSTCRRHPSSRCALVESGIRRGMSS